MAENDQARPSTESEVADAVKLEDRDVAFQRLQQMPVDELQAKVAEVGPIAWKAGLLFIGVFIPFEEYKTPEEIKEHGTQIEANLEAGVFTGSNFAQLGLGEARLKVALLMHAIEALQSEVIQEANQAGLLDSLKASSREQA